MTHIALRSRLARTVRAAALLTLCALPAAAQAGGGAQSFHHIDDYRLELDGKPVKSVEMFQSDQAPGILILSSSLPSPVLLRLGTQTAETLNLMKVAKQADGTVKLLPGATLAPQGKFTFGSGVVTFAVDGRKVALKDKPSLLGPQTSAAIKAYSPATYVEGGKTYRPDPASIAVLKKAATPVRVQVFFGSWCPHCQQTLPKLFRVEDQLKGSKIRFEYFGVPKQGMANVPEFKKLSLNGVPSGVVYANGREIGRLVGGEAWVTPEVALKGIVAGAARTAAKGR